MAEDRIPVGFGGDKLWTSVSRREVDTLAYNFSERPSSAGEKCLLK
jgi:hypothetical protein